MKEEMFYVTEDQLDERSLETIRSHSYELPDGQQISLQSERVTFTEKMFTPSAKLPGFTGIQHMIVESIGKSDIDIRRDLF
jgi:actin-related protein